MPAAIIFQIRCEINIPGLLCLRLYPLCNAVSVLIINENAGAVIGLSDLYGRVAFPVDVIFFRQILTLERYLYSRQPAGLVVIK